MHSSDVTAVSSGLLVSDQGSVKSPKTSNLEVTSDHTRLTTTVKAQTNNSYEKLFSWRIWKQQAARFIHKVKTDLNHFAANEYAHSNRSYKDEYITKAALSF